MQLPPVKGKGALKPNLAKRGPPIAIFSQGDDCTQKVNKWLPQISSYYWHLKGIVEVFWLPLVQFCQSDIPHWDRRLVNSFSVCIKFCWSGEVRFNFFNIALLNFISFGREQCDQMGRFSKVLVGKFSYKCSQNIHWSLGLFRKTPLWIKILWYYEGSFWKFLGYFLFRHLVNLLLR